MGVYGVGIESKIINLGPYDRRLSAEHLRTTIFEERVSPAGDIVVLWRNEDDNTGSEFARLNEPIEPSPDSEANVPVMVEA